MSNSYDLISYLRKWKLKRYKKKKVRKEKGFRNRAYFLTFSIKVDDPLNPHKIDKKYHMVVPAKAAFFAKAKAIETMRSKISLEFLECEKMSEEECEEFENTKEQYIKNVAEVKNAND